MFVQDINKIVGHPFMQEFASILEINAENLDDQTFVHHGDGWDSINLMTTIALIDKYYGIVLNLDLLNKVSTFGELKEAIAKAVEIEAENQIHPSLQLVS